MASQPISESPLLEALKSKENAEADCLDEELKLTKKVPSRRRRDNQPYKQIPNEIRAEIIRRVILLGEKLAKVARDLKVNYTTANSIIHVYKKNGRVSRIPQKFRKKPSKADDDKKSSELNKQQSPKKLEEMMPEKNLKAHMEAMQWKSRETNEILSSSIKKTLENNIQAVNIPNLLKDGNMNDSNAFIGYQNTNPGALMMFPHPLASSMPLFQPVQSNFSFVANSFPTISRPSLGELIHANAISEFCSNLQRGSANPFNPVIGLQQNLLPGNLFLQPNFPGQRSPSNNSNWPF